jgi:lipoprotein signal peptidase
MPVWGMARLSARNAALAALVLVDAALKIAARAFLRGKDISSRPSSPLRLGYVENSTGFGFDQSRLFGRYGVATDDGFIVCTLAVFLVLALLIHLWHRVGGRPWIKTLAAAVLYMAAAMLALSLNESIHLSLAPSSRGILRALGPLAVAIVLYVEVEKPYYSFLSLIFLAGTIGNCASMIIPPFAVIDYFGIYRPSIGAYVYANAADAYLVFSGALVALIPIYLIVAFIAKRRPHGRA